MFFPVGRVPFWCGVGVLGGDMCAWSFRLPIVSPKECVVWREVFSNG